MKVYAVVLSEAAARHLRQITDYIADQGGVRTAQDYASRLQGFCRSLGDMPHRGTIQADGSRLLGFERRVSVRFVVDGDTVQVLALLYAGRQETSP